MSRELWLLRHGKSDRDVVMDDFDRPLKKRGKQAVQRVGAWMLREHLMPDIILSSPATRAINTARLVCKAIGADKMAVQQDKRLYFQGLEKLKRVLSECPIDAGRVLLVGHNPDLEMLLLDLVGGPNVPDTDKLLPTAAFARIAMPKDWRSLDAGCSKLLSITYAQQLPE
ncbi:MAG: histidine phosphatase family protein [Methylovulum sp.]|nr:histidine phosphatase family protein [Methylovulum sp.]